MSDKPHVLLISTDHWPAALLGSAGHPSILTPTLDELARSGTRFTNAYAECPICIPARRTLMTGTSPKTHGDRIFKTNEPMPNIPTLAQTFRNAGYQAYGVGKLHVYPQRDRIGFDDVILAEEGRPHLGTIDDHDIFLSEQGFAGQGFAHGMSNNEYSFRPWHLPENTHVTNWATSQMCRMIKRRDPNRPGFWYLSYCHPHPPLVPLNSYLNLYSDIEIDEVFEGAWADDPKNLPFTLQQIKGKNSHINKAEIKRIRRVFYALCTHIDHQLRLVLGTLREEGLLDDAILLFTSDHGDMLGNHGLWAKRLFYEGSANVPMILVGGRNNRVEYGSVEHRLVGWRDIMPTLLDLAEIDVPKTVEGLSMIGSEKRDSLYGECGEGSTATRMIRNERHKLIYYPTGNRLQLFDLQEDPCEKIDLSESDQHKSTFHHLTTLLINELYDQDMQWVSKEKLIGLPELPHIPSSNKGLSGVRGIHFPPPPIDNSGSVVGFP